MSDDKKWSGPYGQAASGLAQGLQEAMNRELTKAMTSDQQGPQEFSKGIREADYMEVPEEINVYSWSPAPPGTQNAKCTQVHLHFGAPPGPVFFVRFKGPRTLDRIIKALQDHRRDVWG